MPSRPDNVALKAVLTLNQLPSHVLLLTRSKQYSYRVARAELAQVNVADERLILEAPLMGEILLKAAGAVAGTTVMVRFLSAVLAAESVARTVKVDTADVVGVPEINPVAVFNVSPAGSEPSMTAQDVEPEAPVVVRVCE